MRYKFTRCAWRHLKEHGNRTETHGPRCVWTLPHGWWMHAPKATAFSHDCAYSSIKAGPGVCNRSVMAALSMERGILPHSKVNCFLLKMACPAYPHSLDCPARIRTSSIQ